MNFVELIQATKETHCNDELVVSLMQRAWDESKHDNKPLAQIKYVDYPCQGWFKNKSKPFYTVQNTSATVILQTLREAEDWAVENGMRAS
jgi:hypothetical protein